MDGPIIIALKKWLGPVLPTFNGFEAHGILDWFVDILQKAISDFGWIAPPKTIEDN